MAKNGVTVLFDNVAKIAGAIETLTRTRVMVGVPAEKAKRKGGEPMNNATLLYIHENGAPEANIPARPSLGPGVERVQDAITSGLGKAGTAALDGKPEVMQGQFHKVGAIARDSVKTRITEGISPALKPATIKARQRSKTKGSKYRRKASTASQVTPLVDTGAMLGAISYVVRERDESEE